MTPTDSFTPAEDFHSGYVMLLGRPNVGKSTLLNAIMNEELAIVTPKPQTTRRRILGIYTRPQHQIIFMDAPGVVKDKRGLNAFLAREVQRAMDSADVIVLIVEAFEPAKQSEELLLERLRKLKQPVILAINKVDKAAKPTLLPLIDDYRQRFPFRAIVPISARKKSGVDGLLAEVAAALPLGPMFFPPDQITDATERFLCGEMVREQIFLLTRQEIPYCSAVLVEEFKDEDKLVRIHADVWVEREGHKGIVIGQGGEMLKRIGSNARRKMEAFLGKQVYLELQVKVKENWTRSEGKLRQMGFE
jgi:GTP-binding protein Era